MEILKFLPLPAVLRVSPASREQATKSSTMSWRWDAEGWGTDNADYKKSSI